MTILVVTHSKDNEAPARVVGALRQRGADVLRVNSDGFPTAIELDFDPATGEGWLRIDDRVVSVVDISAVWVRRLAVGHDLPTDLAVPVRQACMRESSRALRGLLDRLRCPVVGRPRAVTAASDKCWQLEAAQREGLAVPATRVSNAPDGVRALSQRADGALVAKMLHPFSVSLSGQAHVVHTSAVAPSDLADLDGLSCSPMVFQARVHAVREYRVVVVGDHVMTAVLERPVPHSIDWRVEAAELASRWRVGQLSAELVSGVTRLCRSLGLCSASIDLVEDAQGRVWFLEVNPAGEWLWLETLVGLDVSGALADLLTQRA